MKHDCGFAIRITADLPVEMVAVSDIEHPNIERIQFGEEAHREELSRYPGFRNAFILNTATLSGLTSWRWQL